MNALRPPPPRELQIEVTGACNLSCGMCLVRYAPRLDRRGGSLGLATFKRIVDENPNLRRITLQGLGEPLLAPDLMRMIEYAAARSIRVGFNTNGTLLTQDRSARLVDLGLAWLHVSVDGATARTYESIRAGSSFARVQENVIALVDYMRGKSAEHPELEIVFVAMRRNIAELPALVELADRWGVRRVWVQNLSHSFADIGGNGGYRRIREFTEREQLWMAETATSAILASAARRADDLGVRLRLPRFSEQTRRRRDGTPGCDWPWRSTYIRHDGRVQPCCMLMGESRAIQGDLGDEDLSGIWHGASYRSFRAGLLGDDPPDVCRGCALYRGVF